MFITLDGIDGGGKSTVAGVLVKLLSRELRAVEVHLTREPGGLGNHIGEQVRRIMLENANLLPETHAMLITSSRLEHCCKFIIPALRAGHAVVSDRFSASTYVYQFLGAGLDLSLFNVLESLVRNVFISNGLNPGPELQLILDTDYKTSTSRLRNRHCQELNHFDNSGEDLFNARRTAYLRYAREYPNCVLIDASLPQSTVVQLCLDAVVKHVGRTL